MLMSILGSIFAGGATGLIGTAISRLGDFFQQRENHKHELELMRENRETMKVRGELNMQAKDAEAFESSIAADKAAYTTGKDLPKWAEFMLAFVDFVRGLMRPALTIYLIVLTSLIYHQIDAVLKAAGVQSIQADLAADLLRKIILTILYLTTTCVTWWFGTRTKAKPPFGDAK